MAGLWDALKQYIGDALPGGALNPETQPVATQANYLSGILDPASQVSQDAQAWHKRTQNGLMDQLAGRDTPEAEQAYQTMMQAAGMAPVGMIAWHGSPHKFDKFSLDKIGTGEGAQAYGHGLYLAESPEVAQSYQSTVRNIIGQNDRHLYAFGKSNKWDIQKTKEDIERAIGFVKDDLKANPADASAKDALNQYTSLLSNLSNESLLKVKGDGQLYKTDIPDEAVARFLDWDKPLSEQAPEVQAALQNIRLPMIDGQVLGKTGYTTAVPLDKALGQNAYDALAWRERAQGASDQLKAAGIPGIRYLDGGSRGTGTGTSNFVAFDPELIRILERNGQPTGLQPWKPGEWKR